MARNSTFRCIPVLNSAFVWSICNVQKCLSKRTKFAVTKTIQKSRIWLGIRNQALLIIKKKSPFFQWQEGWFSTIRKVEFWCYLTPQIVNFSNIFIFVVSFSYYWGLISNVCKHLELYFDHSVIPWISMCTYFFLINLKRELKYKNTPPEN